MLLGVLATVDTQNEAISPVISVDIVDPVKIEPPAITKKKEALPPPEQPVPDITRRRPPEEKLPPDSLFGGVKEPAPETSEDSEKSRESEKPEDEVSYTEKEDTMSSASSDKTGPAISEKEGLSSDPGLYLFDRKTIEKIARKSEPPGTGLTFDTSEFKNRGYMRMLKEKIENIWKYPEEAARLGISGDLYIKFSINRDGKLDKIELLRTSGYRYLDEAAMKALKDAEPYWPLPDDWDKDVLEIKGHFIYIFGRTFVM